MVMNYDQQVYTNKQTKTVRNKITKKRAARNKQKFARNKINNRKKGSLVR